jgi:hypothetical protein
VPPVFVFDDLFYGLASSIGLPRQAWARSSVVEHTLHTGGVASSILAAPTTLILTYFPFGLAHL